jgi:hypothetical protein
VLGAKQGDSGHRQGSPRAPSLALQSAKADFALLLPRSTAGRDRSRDDDHPPMVIILPIVINRR